jgi:hypothetical protein
MIELTRRKMLSVTAAAVAGALASARATRPARANYINEINLQRIRNDPSFFKELWDTTYSVRESLGFDLGKEFLVLNDHGYLAAFACVTAYDLTSYGNEPRIGPDYTLKELLAAPHLACDLYCIVTALLFRRVRPKSPERFWMAGWDHGAVGNHAQLFVEGVGLPLMLDPTIGAVAIADYNDVKANMEETR